MNGNKTNKWQGFEKNKQNINRKWPPRKGISLVNAQMVAEGYAPATKQDIEATYMSILQLDQEGLEAKLKDKKLPMLVRILAWNLLSKKWFEVSERMLDRGIGKAKENVAVAGSVDVSSESMKAIQILIKQRNARRKSTSESHGW